MRVSQQERRPYAKIADILFLNSRRRDLAVPTVTVKACRHPICHAPPFSNTEQPGSYQTSDSKRSPIEFGNAKCSRFKPMHSANALGTSREFPSRILHSSSQWPVCLFNWIRELAFGTAPIQHRYVIELYAATSVQKVIYYRLFGHFPLPLEARARRRPVTSCAVRPQAASNAQNNAERATTLHRQTRLQPPTPVAKHLADAQRIAPNLPLVVPADHFFCSVILKDQASSWRDVCAVIWMPVYRGACEVTGKDHLDSSVDKHVVFGRQFIVIAEIAIAIRMDKSATQACSVPTPLSAIRIIDMLRAYRSRPVSQVRVTPI